MIGGRVGFYEVLHKIGEGGMGTVYLGRDRRSDQRIALKVLSPTHALDLERRARFLREAELGQLVRHQNVVTVHELGEAHLRGAERTLYLAMEMVAGRELGQRLAFESLGQDVIVDLGRQIAEGLAAAHDAGVVHRDVKPGNVLVSSDGIAKLLDFGLASRLDERSQASEFATRTSTFVGTLGYAPPEQVAGARADARSDLFSLGVLLYQATTGRVPFPAQNRNDAIAGFGRGLVAPSALVPGIAPGLETLVRDLLALRPEERPQSAAEVARRLRELAEREARSLAVPLEGAREPGPQTGAGGGAFSRLLRRWRRGGS